MARELLRMRAANVSEVFWGDGWKLTPHVVTLAIEYSWALAVESIPSRKATIPRPRHLMLAKVAKFWSKW